MMILKGKKTDIYHVFLCISHTLKMNYIMLIYFDIDQFSKIFATVKIKNLYYGS